MQYQKVSNTNHFGADSESRPTRGCESMHGKYHQYSKMSVTPFCSNMPIYEVVHLLVY